MTNHNGERTKERIAWIVAWYDIAKRKALDELDGHRTSLLLEVRSRCEHEMLPWAQVDQEMFVGWITEFSRRCKWCGLLESQKSCPVGLDYTPIIKTIPGLP